MKRFVFIRMWSSPPIARSIENTLRQSFSDYEMDIIDVVKRIKRRPDIVLINGLATLLTYWRPLLKGAHGFKEFFWRTPYLFRRVQSLLRGEVTPQRYAFSIQLQSLFDASQPGVPHFMYTDHTHLANLDYPGFDRSQLFAPAWVELEKTAYAHARLIFTRSSNITASLVQQYGLPPEKVVIVYAGSNVPIGQTDGKDARDGSDRKNGKDILFVGIDWERKGGPDLVEAFRRVRQVHPDATLTVVGCAPEMDVENSRAVGKVPVGEVEPFYRKAAIFCLPTTLEPFGIVFIEALAAGLPIVATNVGAVPDFVVAGENGYLVEPHDVDSLAQALTTLLEQPEQRLAFGARSYQLAQERYNWDNVGRLLRRHIEKAIAV